MNEVRKSCKPTCHHLVRHPHSHSFTFYTLNSRTKLRILLFFFIMSETACAMPHSTQMLQIEAAFSTFSVTDSSLSWKENVIRFLFWTAVWLLKRSLLWFFSFLCFSELSASNRVRFNGGRLFSIKSYTGQLCKYWSYGIRRGTRFCRVFAWNHMHVRTILERQIWCCN